MNDLKSYKVSVIYEMIVSANDENEAAKIADGAIGSFVWHPQTIVIINPDIEVEEVESSNEFPNQ